MPGATLIITKDTTDGDKVAGWVSSDTLYSIKLGDGIYVLTEVIASENYKIAESITFTVVALEI